MGFEAFFGRATGGGVPFDFQKRIAETENWPDVLHVPTGAGKTAAAVLGWLWRRHTLPAETPRRLIYCLPMRVLVEQTVGAVETWLRNLEPGWQGRLPKVYGLLGGAVEQGWESEPEEDAILVGTQDQLLSRALNRGYAMSRFKWPIHFGLLHNDAQWIFDEVQLMGPGLETSTQLEGLRRKLGSVLPTRSLWMSATLDTNWLRTVDFDSELSVLRLDGVDAKGSLAKRLQAAKPVTKAALPLRAKEADLAKWIATVHRPGTLTLVVVNQVARAQGVYQALAKAAPGVDRLLLHSRFRGADRRMLEQSLRTTSATGEIGWEDSGGALSVAPADSGRIVVATQTIEAGVDLSASTLITELAPWTSLVQRFGRCNRLGEDDGARIFWIDLDEATRGAAAPYEPEELEQARTVLEGLRDARPDQLPEAAAGRSVHHVLRRRDLIDLFDTDPDLDGNHVDVSRFIREPGGADVAVFWRNTGAETPSSILVGPAPEEVCLVSISRFREFVARGKRNVWQWDSLEGRWARVHRDSRGEAPGFVAPGFTYLVDCAEGGYSSEAGFDPTLDGSVREYAAIAATEPAEAVADDPIARRDWLDLQTHSLDVRAAARELSLGLLSDKGLARAVTDAAHWHDAGKAHPIFQDAARSEGNPFDSHLAKAPKFKKYTKRGFRHELVSALQALEMGQSDLVAYLIVAHHGKVRLQIRPLANEGLESHERLAARGVSTGDVVPEVDLGDGLIVPSLTLDLGIMRMGKGRSGPSWSERTSALVDEHGPFRLAFLEGLVRIADWRASGAALVPTADDQQHHEEEEVEAHG